MCEQEGQEPRTTLSGSGPVFSASLHSIFYRSRLQRGMAGQGLSTPVVKQAACVSRSGYLLFFTSIYGCWQYSEVRDMDVGV